MSDKIRALIIVIGTTVMGNPVKKGKVLLVPEDISTDNAKTLLNMSRPRAKAASDEQTKQRLTEYKKAQAERAEKEKAAQKEAEKENKGKK